MTIMNKKWKIVKLGDFISIKSGLAYEGEKIGKGNTYLLGMGCVSFSDKFVDEGARLYEGEDVDERYCVKPDDIVLATRQQSDNMPILAMPAIVPKTFEGKKVVIGTNLYKVDNNSEISNQFLYLLLKQQHYVQYIYGVKSGTAVQMVTKKDIEKYKFYCPPQYIRERISNIYWNYDMLIENNNKQIKILEEIAETLYKEWFVHFRFPGYKDVKFDSVKSKGWALSTDETKIHKPQNWNLSEIGNIATFIRGKNITAAQMIDGDIPVVSAGLEPSGYHNSANVKGESITISASGANAGYLSYHLSDIWAADCSYYNDKTNLWFVYNTLKFLQAFINNMQVGSAQPHVYAKNINKISVIIPEEKYILMYCEKVENIYQQIKILMDSNKNLIEQRDLLLPRLMSGKLEIN